MRFHWQEVLQLSECKRKNTCFRVTGAWHLFFFFKHFEYFSHKHGRISLSSRGVFSIIIGIQVLVTVTLLLSFCLSLVNWCKSLLSLSISILSQFLLSQLLPWENCFLCRTVKLSLYYTKSLRKISLYRIVGKSKNE